MDKEVFERINEIVSKSNRTEEDLEYLKDHEDVLTNALKDYFENDWSFPIILMLLLGLWGWGKPPTDLS